MAAENTQRTQCEVFSRSLTTGQRHSELMKKAA